MQKRVVTKEDLYQLQWPGNPALSPDGQWVVYERTVMRKQEDDYETHLILADAKGTVRRTLTSAGSRNAAAVWSPDGRTLAFLSNRAYGTQLWLLPVADGGEARRLTKFVRGIDTVVWAPDGSALYGIVSAPADGDVEVYDEGLSVTDAKKQTDDELEEWRDHAKRYDWMYYKRDGGGLTRGYRRQLVSVDAVSGLHRQLTRGKYDIGEAAVSPDGQYLVFASNRRPNHEIDLRADLYRVSTMGGDLELLCDHIDAERAAWSPDGASLAVFGHRNEYETATQTKLFVLPAAGGDAVDWTENFPDQLGNASVGDMRNHEHTPLPLWSRDGQSLYALSSREGACEIVCFSRHGQQSVAEVVIGGSREIYGFSFDGVSRFAIAYSTPAHPGLVAVVETAGASTSTRPQRAMTDGMLERHVPRFPAVETRLDDCNDAFLSEVHVPEPTPFWYTSEDDWRVQGFVLRPAEFVPGSRYPVILEIHGGPHAMYNVAYFHEMQFLAAQGYAVVFVNPRGSHGYGQEFVNACRHDYGGRDAADILHGLDAALSQFDFLDPQRIAVTGGSYGGFMTNWLVGHTNRFFAAAAQRSISNWISFYGVSDIGPMFTEQEIGGDVMHDMEKLWRHSPLAFARQVETPLLLIHGENDLRCPIEQAEQFYTCLKRLGREVELVRVPNASHDLSRSGKPKLRLARLDAIFRFIDDRVPGKVDAEN